MPSYKKFVWSFIENTTVSSTVNSKHSSPQLQSPLLQELRRQRQIWRASEQVPDPSSSAQELEPCQYAELDHALGGGLPKQGLLLINSNFALGELRLLQHYLRKRLQDRLLAMIAPPHDLSSDALIAMGLNVEQLLLITQTQRDESLWSAEQCLQSGRCALVLLWEEALTNDRKGQARASRALTMAESKRLKLAAEAGSSTMIVFRKPASPNLAADINMELEAKPRGLCIHIPKRQRGWPLRDISVDFSRDWPELCVPKRPQNVIPLQAYQKQAR
ncbi:hypothetical protein [Pseudoteredinibacter isoporae]|uniref:Cell division inhibitor SulA n=1 Tax=Pseudoteredinibacter isoporae TaxID=570281 RepID=A0A7X0JSA4_9GAMM|nr:hypothetical protein [Pseudoteredinibacter isoporae]MBB6521368.1 cell division inhibitor SulA [Pseudoteredinibacter isoporae]NHO86923.1 hypothetical protein [Pseudoteredinibacter isoporae]NIB24624.1 hypothetical protein [Pseudoteredinibacter isoporae]